MLINEIGVADEHVVEIASRRVNDVANPKDRETLAMAVQAALSHMSDAMQVAAHDRPPATDITGLTSARTKPASATRSDVA